MYADTQFDRIILLCINILVMFAKIATMSNCYYLAIAYIICNRKANALSVYPSTRS